MLVGELKVHSEISSFMEGSYTDTSVSLCLDLLVKKYLSLNIFEYKLK